MTNRVRWLVTAVVACAVLAPATLPDPHDGFPISTYPMFTTERGRVIAIDTAVLVHAGHRERLSPDEIGGTDEIVLAAVTVSNAIAAGPAALDRLCHDIARRVDGTGRIEIVTETHDTIALLRNDSPPRSAQLHAQCEVAG